MKKSRIVAAGLILALVAASFFFGRYATEQENRNARLERCSTLIKFAIDKAENGDLTDAGTMRAMISNVYAAYQFCDDGKAANQLHKLWNYLIFETTGSIDGVKEIALQELSAVLHSIKTSD